MAVSRRKKKLREEKLKREAQELKREKLFACSKPVEKFRAYTPRETYRRDLPEYPSHEAMVGSTSLPERKVYTGDLVKGISTMHKSNAVPIIDEQEAKDHASMRR